MTRDSILKPSSLAFAALGIGLCLLCIAAIGRAPNLRDFVFFQTGMLGLTALPCLALYFLRKPDPVLPLPLRAATLTLLLWLGLSLLIYAWNPRIVQQILEIIQRRFQHPSWHHLGLLLAAIVYSPLIASTLRRKIRQCAWEDLIVAGGSLLFIIALYLPSGLDSIAHWESWNYRAYLDGQFSWAVSYEFATRFWVALPHLLGALISPESFAGFHSVNALMLWGKTLLLYGILRQLGFSRLFAYLASLLFLVYPVNSDLLSLRSLPNQFSAMGLLAAGYFALRFREEPTRFGLILIWLALVFNVVVTETAYALILVLPLIWLAPRPRWRPSQINLTVIWLLFPAIKVAYLLLMASLDMRFYNSYVFEGAVGREFSGFAGAFSQALAVYQRSFIDGWLDAIASVSWLRLSQSLLPLLLAFAIAIVLWRKGERSTCSVADKPGRVSLLALLCILPAVGVLIWLPQYADGAWRMYFYAPIFAAIAVTSLLFLLMSRMRKPGWRAALIIGISLLLTLPATTRLLLQRERLVERADDKARFLAAVVELAPKLRGDAMLLLTTSMSQAQFIESAISELQFSAGLDNSMLYLIYNDGATVRSTFCLDLDNCQGFGDEPTIFTAGMAEELLPRALVLVVHADLSVTLVDDPARYFDLPVNAAYDLSLLVDFDAPLPSRVKTMLGIEA